MSRLGRSGQTAQSSRGWAAAPAGVVGARGGVLRLAAGVSWIRAPPTVTELGGGRYEDAARCCGYFICCGGWLEFFELPALSFAYWLSRSFAVLAVDAQRARRRAPRRSFSSCSSAGCDRVWRARALREVLRAAPLVQTPRRANRPAGEALGRASRRLRKKPSSAGARALAWKKPSVARRSRKGLEEGAARLGRCLCCGCCCCGDFWRRHPGQAAARGRLHRGGRDGADGPLGRGAGPAGHDRDPPRRHQGQGAGGRPKGPALLARGGGARGRRRRRAETRRRAAVAHGTHRAPRAQGVDYKKAHDGRAGQASIRPAPLGVGVLWLLYDTREENRARSIETSGAPKRAQASTRSTATSSSSCSSSSSSRGSRSSPRRWWGTLRKARARRRARRAAPTRPTGSHPFWSRASPSAAASAVAIAAGAAKGPLPARRQELRGRRVLRALRPPLALSAGARPPDLRGGHVPPSVADRRGGAPRPCCTRPCTGATCLGPAPDLEPSRWRQNERTGPCGRGRARTSPARLSCRSSPTICWWTRSARRESERAGGAGSSPTALWGERYPCKKCRKECWEKAPGPRLEAFEQYLQSQSLTAAPCADEHLMCEDVWPFWYEKTEDRGWRPESSWTAGVYCMLMVSVALWAAILWYVIQVSTSAARGKGKDLLFCIRKAYWRPPPPDEVVEKAPLVDHDEWFENDKAATRRSR